jgi:glutathione peroxidase
MAGLQVLEDKFGAQGFAVAGFYSNDFNQVGDPDKCDNKYMITFDTFRSDPVKGANARPVFKWLAGEPNPGPASSPAPTWNFHKYLVSKTGKVVAHWPEDVAPPTSANDESNVIVKAIKAELAK